MLVSERTAEAAAEVHDGDHHDVPPEPPRPVVRLRGDPPRGVRVLDNVLTHLREDDRERHDRCRRVVEFRREHSAGPALHSVDDLVHVRIPLDGGDLEQDVRGKRTTTRRMSIELEDSLSLPKEAHPTEVTEHVDALGQLQTRQRALAVSCDRPRRQEGHHAGRVDPAHVTGVEERSLLAHRRDGVEQVVDRLVVQRSWHWDYLHSPPSTCESLPTRCRNSPRAPR